MIETSPTRRVVLWIAALALAGAARAAVPPVQPALPEIPEDVAHATIKDAARALGWGEVEVKTLSHVFIHMATTQTGTMTLNERLGTSTLNVYWLRDLQIVRGGTGEVAQSAFGKCGHWEGPTTFHGMKGCIWKGGEAVAWHLERDGRPVLAFRVTELRCLTNAVTVKACQEDPRGGLRLAEALHQAAEKHGLYARFGGERTAVAAAPPVTMPPPSPPPVTRPEPQPSSQGDSGVGLEGETPTPRPRPTPRAKRRPASGETQSSSPSGAPSPEPSSDEPSAGAVAAGTIGAGLLAAAGAWLLGRVTPATSDAPGEAAEGEPAEETSSSGWGAAETGATAAISPPADSTGAQAKPRSGLAQALDEKMRSEQERLGIDPVAREIQSAFKAGHEKLLAEGYRVVNPAYDAALPVQAAVDTVSGVGYYGSAALDAAAAYIAGAPAADATKPVRCEDLGRLGIEDTRARLQAVLGPAADEAVVDMVEVNVQRASTIGGTLLSAVDCVRPRNHVATRVILPDGRRYVLDYWEAMRGGPTQMLSEAEWRARWRERLGGDMVFVGNANAGRQQMEARLMFEVRLAVAGGGSQDEGLATFCRKEAETIRGLSAAPAEKSRLLRQLGTLARSYLRAGAYSEVRR